MPGKYEFRPHDSGADRFAVPGDAIGKWAAHFATMDAELKQWRRVAEFLWHGELPSNEPTPHGFLNNYQANHTNPKHCPPPE